MPSTRRTLRIQYHLKFGHHTGDSMKRIFAPPVALFVLALAPAFAQRKATIQNVPEIPFTAVANFLKLPPGEYLGEAVAVATSSKGHGFWFHRSNNNRLFEFDQNGKFVKEIGSGFLGFEFAHSVRVDKDDNIWTVDEGSNMVTKFSPEGKVLMVLGRRPLSVLGVLPVAPQPPNRTAQKYEFCRPTDIGWTVCVSGGPHQYVFFSNSNPNGNMPGTWDITGEIYKAELDGRVLGRFGRPGKAAPGFQVVHMIDCRNPNEIIVGEIESWRAQKLILKAPSGSGGAQ